MAHLIQLITRHSEVVQCILWLCPASNCEGSLAWVAFKVNVIYHEQGFQIVITEDLESHS